MSYSCKIHVINFKRQFVIILTYVNLVPARTLLRRSITRSLPLYSRLENYGKSSRGRNCLAGNILYGTIRRAFIAVLFQIAP